MHPLIVVLIVVFALAFFFIIPNMFKSFYRGKNNNPFEGKKVIFVMNDNEPENADGVKGHLE